MVICRILRHLKGDKTRQKARRDVCVFMTGVMIENVNELAGYSAPHRACEGCFQAIARGPLRLVILTDGESENVNELAGYAVAREMQTSQNGEAPALRLGLRMPSRCKGGETKQRTRHV